MTDKGVSTEGATFSEDDGRFLITTSDGSEYELLNELAYNAAVAAQTYGTTRLAPEYFKP